MEHVIGFLVLEGEYYLCSAFPFSVLACSVLWHRSCSSLVFLPSLITASAHTANAGQTNIPLRPRLSTLFLGRDGGSHFCIDVRVFGSRYRAGVVHVVAFAGARFLSVKHAKFSQNGSFTRQVVICRPIRVLPKSIVLWATGPFGGISNHETLLVPFW